MRQTTLSLVFLLLFFQSFSQFVTLYEDCNFRGRSKLLSPGRYNLDRVGFGGNRLSSLRVPSGYKITLYSYSEPGTGRSISIARDVSCLGSDWNDRVLSVSIEPDNGNASGGNRPGANYPVYPSYGSGEGYRVILYEDCGLMGNNIGLGPGSYDTRSMGIRNDAISSIRIPRGYSVTVFRDGGFRGESRTYYANVYCMDGPWTDQVSSIIIRGPGSQNPPGGNSNSGQRVVAYDQCNFGGNRGEFKPGSYKTGYLIVGNDRISSIRVPNGFRVTVFTDNDFRGSRRTFTGDQYCLDVNWNDRISSMVVEGPNSGNTDNQLPEFPPANYSGVSVYWDSWYRGAHVVFNPGYHDLRNSSMNSNISSLTIQPGYRVTIFDDFNFRGRSQTFTGSVPNLSLLGWNDRIRSLMVSRY